MTQEHTMNWPNRRQGYDPNIHGPNANQGDGPVKRGLDTADIRGMEMLAVVLAVVLFGVPALIWAWRTFG
jgi:hypothetical protein